ncbi:MAG: radical SAM protein [Clostridiales bacterium]|nr:radical SAM protein [Clostridiales bacterium]
MSGAKGHILPFFIPMQGCANRCVYCDQHIISGQLNAPAPQQIEREALAYTGPRPAQIAFYGGSFTALPPDIQKAYLQAAKPALKRGLIDSIRVSTRPDAIDDAALNLLAAYGVTTVELGIQSFDEDVLNAAGRTYSPKKARMACLAVHQAGFSLGVQLMTGLPLDTPQKSLRSIEQSCEIPADFFRIYPTLVLQNTPLAAMYAQGAYKPQELGEAVALAADMLAIAAKRGIGVIRLGLNPSPSLERALVAGPYHPAFGQMVRGELKLRQAAFLLEQANGEAVLLGFPPKERPLLFGQKNEQWQRLQTLYPGLAAKEDALLPHDALRVLLKAGESITLSLDDFLKHSIEHTPASAY